MSADQLANMAASMLVVVACLVFGVTYHRLTTWWRSDIGRNLMWLAVAMGALFLYTVLVSQWPDGCFAMVLRWVRAGLAVVIAAVMVQRTRVLLKEQRKHRNRTGV